MARYGSRYDKYTSSFSGTDMIVSFVFPDAAPLTVGTATNITYSIYRQLAHVRTLGRISSKGYARGGRTCAGTIVMTVIKESFVEDMRTRLDYLGDFKSLKPDELPPFDIILTFGNEFGQTSSLVIYGVSFTDETMTFSIEDIFTENVLTFLARDIRHMKGDAKQLTYGKSKFRASDEILGTFKLSDLIATDEAAERKKRLAEIEKSKKARWEEPVLTTPPAKSDSAGSSSGSSSSNSSSNGTTGTVKVVVKDGNGKLVSGATVWYENAGGTKTSGTTGSDGTWSKSIKLGGTFSVYAKKTGYSQNMKKITTKEGSSPGTVNLVIYKSTSGGSVPDAKDSVAFVNFASGDDYKKSQSGTQNVKKAWAQGSGPKVKLTNSLGNPLSGIKVVWEYNVVNYDDCPWYKKALFKMQWPQKKMNYGSSTTNSSGIAVAPPLDFNSAFDSAIIEVTAIPYRKVDLSSGTVSKSMYKTFTFKQDDGGL